MLLLTIKYFQVIKFCQLHASTILFPVYHGPQLKLNSPMLSHQNIVLVLHRCHCVKIKKSIAVGKDKKEEKQALLSSLEELEMLIWLYHFLPPRFFYKHVAFLSSFLFHVFFFQKRMSVITLKATKRTKVANS